MSRILHTADWHLGARLLDQPRHAEHEAFLAWLLAQMRELRPDLLIIAGDIFDQANPAQEALRMYYRFLASLAREVRCRVLVLGGNHDSPSLLHAPREILETLDVTVLAEMPDDPAQCLLELPDAVVCAVPFLREREVRRAVAGESGDAIAAAIREGIAQHYRTVYAAACAVAQGRPILATGHLTAQKVNASESERAVHIGNLGAVDSACFEGFAYTALGHIHKPQAVGGNELIRYAGTPLPLDFSELGVPKELRIIEIQEHKLTHRSLPVPTFRSLARLETTVAQLRADLQQAAAAPDQPCAWIELTVTDGAGVPDLERLAREAAEGLNLRVLKLIRPRPELSLESAAAETLLLQELNPQQVFATLLQQRQIAEGSAAYADLQRTFAELLESLHQAPESAHA